MANLWITGIAYHVGERLMARLAPKKVRGKWIWRNDHQRRAWRKAYRLGRKSAPPGKFT